MSQRTAYTFADGVIHFGADVPRGALPIARGDEDRLATVFSELAQRGDKLGLWLVPGVSSAADQGQALERLMEFRDRVHDRLLQAA